MKFRRWLRRLGHEIRHGLATSRLEAEVAVSQLAGFDHGPVVAASIDGGPALPFLVDTGAEGSSIFFGHPAAQRVRPLRFYHPGETIGVGGLRSRVPGYVPVRSLRIGAAEARHFDMGVVDEEISAKFPRSDEIPGNIGQDVLRNWSVLFDATTGEVRFLDPNETTTEALRRLYPAASDWIEHSINWAGPENNLPFVDLRVQGQGPFRFLVDTGCTGAFVSGKCVQALGLERKGSREKFGLGGPYDSGIHDVAAIEFGGTEVSVTNGDLGEPEYGYLGWAILRHFVFALDGPDSRLWVAYDGEAARTEPRPR